MELGRKIWAIAEGYIPSKSSSRRREFISHETACILNTTEREAHIQLLVYFSDKDPQGPYIISVAPQRTLHLRFNDLQNPPIPKDTDYSSVFISDVPIVVQHTRLDSRRAKNALLTTIAFSE